MCGYCGVIWRRSQLVRDRSGQLVCPDDRRGRDVATLSFLNAQGAANRQVSSGAPSDGIVSTTETITPTPGPTDAPWVPPQRSF